jgi:hypothetical protein
VDPVVVVSPATQTICPAEATHEAVAIEMGYDVVEVQEPVPVAVNGAK